MMEQPAKRVPYGAWIESPNSPASFHLAQGLSLTGLHLLGEDPPELGAQLQLQLVVENEPRVMAAEGEVVKHDAGADRNPSFAVRFRDMEPNLLDFLDALSMENAER